MIVTKILTNSISPRDSGICGDFNVILDDSLCIHHIMVINGRKGLFIAFPNTKEEKRFMGNTRYLDIVHPTTNSLREYIQSEVLSYYNKELENLK